MSIADIPLTLEKWDSLLREYLESGGRRLSFEERRAALLMLLPQKFREEVFFRIPEMQAAADYSLSDDAQDVAVTKLRAQVQRQAELMVQWSAMNGRQEPAHMLGGGDNQYGGDPYWDSSNADQSQDILYGAKGWKGKGGKGKGKDSGKGGKGGKGKEGPPLCANCGKEGHTVAQCRLPMKPWSERPCHRCGRNGHLSFNCPEKPKPAHVVDEPAAEVEPAKHIWMLTSVASKHCCVSPIELTNKFASLDNEEELPGQCGCPEQAGTSVTSGSEYVAGRSRERERKVPADQVCRGSGSSCDGGLPGTPLMSPYSAPEGLASSDSCPIGQCTAVAGGEIRDGGCPGGQTANRAAQSGSQQFEGSDEAPKRRPKKGKNRCLRALQEDCKTPAPGVRMVHSWPKRCPRTRVL